MIETVTIQYVNDKPKYPKFNSGALLVGEKDWVNVAKDVDIKQFKKGQTMELEIETNDKGYKLVTGIVKALNVPSISPLADKPQHTLTPAASGFNMVKTRDFDAEAKGKSRFGLYASIAPSLVLSGHTDDEIKKRAEELVEYFMGKIFSEK